MISNLIQCNSTSLAPLIILRLTEGHTHTLSSEKEKNCSRIEGETHTLSSEKKNCSRIEGEKWFFLPSLPRSENSSRFLVPLSCNNTHCQGSSCSIQAIYQDGRRMRMEKMREGEKMRGKEGERRESSKGKTGTVISQNRLHSLFPSFFSLT